jgi:hypothetical protein
MRSISIRKAAAEGIEGLVFSFSSLPASLETAAMSKDSLGSGHKVGYSVGDICGRFARKSTQEVLAEWFDLELEEMPWFAPSYNAAPQSIQPVVCLNRDSGRREGALLRWGLVPFWILLANSVT